MFRSINKIIKSKNISSETAFEIIDYDKDGKVSVMDMKYFFRELRRQNKDSE